MKRLWFALAILLAAAVMIALAQTPGSSISVSNSTNCAAPAAGIFALCMPKSGGGVEYTNNGSAYATANFSGGGAASVTSVFGRTGAVTAEAGDYSYAQLSSPPTTITCSTVTVVDKTLTASGCTIK